MTRKRKKRYRKAGMPPGSLVHIGEPVEGRPTIKAVRYSETDIAEFSPETVDDSLRVDEDHILWVNVGGVHDPELVRAIGERFGIHPLNLEDVMNTDHRPKVEDHSDYLFIILKHFHPDAGGELKSEQVSVFLGPRFVLSFEETPDDLFKPVQERLRSGLRKYWSMGPGYLAYCLLDTVIDNYFVIMEQFDDAIDRLEEQSSGGILEGVSAQIQSLRREIIYVRRAVWPLREVIGFIQKRNTSLIDASCNPFFMDIYDHIIQVLDTTETFREILSNLFDIFLSSQSNRMNEIMKVLTIIATTMLPLTLVAGIYGMNFKVMPERDTSWGYYYSLGLMAVIFVSMLVYFRRRKWL